jgi:NAD-dependent dihydropyrimidine dehydrogenase PreA subunit
MVVQIDFNACLACGCCSDACPTGSLELKGRVVYHDEFCTGCKACIELCPAGCIKET